MWQMTYGRIAGNERKVVVLGSGHRGPDDSWSAHRDRMTPPSTEHRRRMNDYDTKKKRAGEIDSHLPASSTPQMKGLSSPDDMSAPYAQRADSGRSTPAADSRWRTAPPDR